MSKAVTYLRVSTPSQRKSGLGIEAQQEAVNALKLLKSFTIEKEFFETESGKNNNRPILLQAMQYCRKHGAILIIAKIDRLGRDAFYIAKLIASGITIIAADKPNASPLDLLEDAIRADREGKAISARTKDALQAAKRRGVPLGTNSKLLVMENRYEAEKYTRWIKPRVDKIRAEGFTSERQIMKALKRKRIRPFRPRSQWHASTVHNLLVNINALPDYVNQDSYKVLFRFVFCITEDEALAAQLLAEHYETVLAEATKDKESSLVDDFSCMLQRMREIALVAMRDRGFDRECDPKEKTFFPFSADVSETHKEVFCLRFYRGVSEDEISTALRLTVEQTRLYLRQAMLDISRHSIIRLPEITDTHQNQHTKHLDHESDNHFIPADDPGSVCIRPDQTPDPGRAQSAQLF